MGEVIQFPYTAGDIYSAKAFETAKELSDHIATLQISKEDNDKLVALMIKNVQEIEKSVFEVAFQAGMEHAVAEHNDN